MKFCKSLFDVLRNAWLDLNTRSTRFETLCTITGIIPGRVGFQVRQAFWPHHIHRSIRILNPNKLIIGDNVVIGYGNFIQAGGSVYIGEETLLGPNVMIWSQNHRFDDPGKLVREQGYDYVPVYIGRDVWIGASVFLLPGTHVGARCIVAGGSVVVRGSYPASSILAGCPAKKIGQRPE